MAHTKLIAVKEKDKVHIKIYYSKEGIKRIKTNVYVKDVVRFNKDKEFKKNNAVSPDSFRDDEKKLETLQKWVENIISKFEEEHHQKPTVKQLESLLSDHKESSQKNFTYVSDYLGDFTQIYAKKKRNEKAVIMAMSSALYQFFEYKNKNYYFKEINEEFIHELIDYLLFKKPKRKPLVGEEVGEPIHRFKDPVEFDEGFGMNNNTLLKRLDAFKAFVKWAVKSKGVNLDYQAVRDRISKEVKQNRITEYSNVEFAFKTIEEVKLLASPEFEESIKDDCYTEYIGGKAKLKGVSKKVLIRAKDFFLISITTATRVSDLRSIKRHNVSLGKQTAKKTNGVFLLNTNESTIKLLKKHDYNMNLSDTKYNKCIKVFLKQFYCDFLKQEDKMVPQLERRGRYEQVKEVPYYTLAASHSGRRSFATINYHKGKPKRTIMQFTGHTDESEFDKYIQLTPEEDIKSFSEDMNLF